MIRWILALMLWLVVPLVGTAPLAAQEPAQPPAAETAGGEGTPAATPPVLTPAQRAQLEALLATLRDDAQREAFLTRLEALLAAQQAMERDGSEIERAALSLRAALERRLEAVARALDDLARLDDQIAFLINWLVLEWQTPERRALWLSVFRSLALALVLGGLGAFALRRGLELLRTRLVGALRPLATALLGLGLELLALAVFALLVGLVLLMAEAPLLARVVARDLVAGLVVGRLVGTAAKLFLAPQDAARRVLPLADATAVDLARRITLANGIFVYGTTALRVAYDLGLPWTLHGLFQRLLYLGGLAVLLAALLHYRRPVATALERASERLPPRWRELLPLSPLARRWHLLVGALLVADYLVFVFEIPGGFAFLSTAVAVTVATAVVLRLSLRAIDRLAARTLAEAERGGLGLWRRYVRLLRTLARIAVLTVAVLVVLQAWGVAILSWFTTPLGQAVLVRLGRIALVLLLAVATIEASNLLFRRWLAAESAEGVPRYGARARTLLSIGRNLVIVVVAFIAGIALLAELGVETGPLLAGAGIIGLAVGFGSQKLVQDIITGLFILIGDVLRVGDVVALGGKAGVVEALSMRTVTLRGYDGQVHVIPYSAIDTISNMTKDFSYWVLDMGVAYREDVDTVMRVMREVDAEMRREWPWRRDMLEPIDIAGLDRFDDSAVVIKARLKTLPGKQWAVGREFQRRLKKRFDELGIEIPFPHRTLYFGTDREGRAPPVFVRLARDGDEPGPSPSSPSS